eukprot:GHVP01049767.1.p1 GENE.GHVP01049767.1~~GHVP01049767.1.p1  ORF type:complete len:207 (+),score=48.13 GHVP01049767.1:763-1383(+)
MSFKIKKNEIAVLKSPAIFEAEDESSLTEAFGLNCDETPCPKDAKSYRELLIAGAQKAENGFYFEAASDFKAATKKCPNSSVAYEQLAQALSMCELWYSAVEASAKAVEYSPSWYVAHWTFGRSLINFGEVEMGVEELMKAKDEIIPDKSNRDECDELNEDIDWGLFLKESAAKHQDSRARSCVVNGRIYGYLPFFELSQLKVDID